MPLNITITGICAFIETLGRVRLMMPRVHASVVHGRTMPEHVAYLKFPRTAQCLPIATDGTPIPIDNPNNLIPRRTPNFAVTTKSTYPSESYVLLLDGEEIALEPVTATNEALSVDFRDVISMARVVGDGSMDATIIASDFDPRSARVACRLDLTAGAVKRGAPKGGSDHMLEFRPHSDLPVYRGRFSQSVLWALAKGMYILKSRRFGSAAAFEKDWQFDASAGDLNIEIGVIPYEDLVNPEAKRVRDREFDAIDHHFHVFYDFLSTPAKSHPLPHRVSAVPNDDRPSGVNCPPVVFTTEQ